MTTTLDRFYERAANARAKLHAFYQPHQDMAFALDTTMREVRYFRAGRSISPSSMASRLMNAVWAAEDFLETPAARVNADRIAELQRLAAGLRGHMISNRYLPADMWGKLDKLDAELAALAKAV